MNPAAPLSQHNENRNQGMLKGPQGLTEMLYSDLFKRSWTTKPLIYPKVC